MAMRSRPIQTRLVNSGGDTLVGDTLRPVSGVNDANALDAQGRATPTGGSVAASSTRGWGTPRGGGGDGESAVAVQVGTAVRYQREAPDAAVTENQIPFPDRGERLIGKRPVASHDVGRHARVDRRDGRTVGGVRSGEE